MDDHFRFDPQLTFAQARERLELLNDTAHQHHVAKLIWLEGTSSGQELTFLWDPMAERFGHQIDKEPIEVEIVSSLMNGIAVEVRLQPSHDRDRDAHQ